MGEHVKVEINKEQLESAEAMWVNFMKVGKYAVIVTVVVLVGLALAFVDFS